MTPVFNIAMVYSIKPITSTLCTWIVFLRAVPATGKYLDQGRPQRGQALPPIDPIAKHTNSLYPIDISSSTNGSRPLSRACRKAHQRRVQLNLRYFTRSPP